MACEFIFMVFRFSSANILATTTEKERGCHVHVLMEDYDFFLKHLNKLFEAKLFVIFAV